jgi:Rnl2 family RNA ligase
MPCTGESAGTIWVELEKIHGAQLVIDIDEDGVRFGKRKGWLQEDEPFFGWQLLRGSLREATREAYGRVGAARLVLYGELFGGGYPHPEVPDRGLIPVQTGVWYAPDLRWVLFEARAIDGEKDEFLSWSESSTLRLLTPPLLLRGRKVEVDALPERFPSRVAAALGLPSLGEGNLAEGLVLKPDLRMPAAAYTASKPMVSLGMRYQVASISTVSKRRA